MVFNRQFLFIIGSPRSGTTWLQTMISSHPMVCSTVELTLYSRYIASWINYWKQESIPIKQGKWYQGLPVVWSEKEFYSFLKLFLEKVYEKVILNNPNATHIIDKHPMYSYYVEDINNLLPRSKFIHLIRDGRDVTVSMIAANQTMGFGAGNIRDAALEWKNYVNAAKKASKYENRYIEIKYEDLINSGNEILKKVFEFCELSFTDKEIHKILDNHRFEIMKSKRQSADKALPVPEKHYRKGIVGSWKHDMNIKDNYIFSKMAGDLLKELNYTENSTDNLSIINKLILELSYTFYKYQLALKK